MIKSQDVCLAHKDYIVCTLLVITDWENMTPALLLLASFTKHSFQCIPLLQEREMCSVYDCIVFHSVYIHYLYPIIHS